MSAAALGGAGAGTGAFLWRGPGEGRGIFIGVALAWILATASAVWIARAKTVSAESFWKAFRGGMILRGAGLLGLMAYSAKNEAVSAPALLMAYALSVLMFLFWEYRLIK